jgi:hypothetical protein
MHRRAGCGLRIPLTAKPHQNPATRHMGMHPPRGITARPSCNRPPHDADPLRAPPTPRPRQPHRRIQGLQQRPGEPGALTPLMLAIVTGPPCSGKSTWVRQQARRSDIHLDCGALPVAFDHAPRHDSSVSGSSLRIASTRPPRPGINRRGRIRHRAVPTDRQVESNPRHARCGQCEGHRL